MIVQTFFSTIMPLGASILALAFCTLWPAEAVADQTKDPSASSAGGSAVAPSSGATATGTGAAPSPASAAPSEAELGPKAAALFKDVSKLIKEYYPNAKPVIKGCHYRLEYKARSFDAPQTNSFDIGPDWGGLVVDMQLKPGPYDGVKAVPCQLNEFSFYVVLLFAPYSPSNNCHLLARISHPFDVPPDFLARLKQLVNGFDQHF